MGNSYNALLFPQSSPFMSCFSYYELTSHINCKSNNKQDWASLDTFTLHPSLLQLCSGPMLYGMLLAGALCCPLSAVPLTGHLVKKKEDFSSWHHQCMSLGLGHSRRSAVPLAASTFIPFSFKTVAKQCFFWSCVLLLDATVGQRSAKWANSARWAWWPRPPLPSESSNCIKHLHASHNNIEVGTLKADAHPVINTNQSPDSSITLDSAAFCVFLWSLYFTI